MEVHFQELATDYCKLVMFTKWVIFVTSLEQERIGAGGSSGHQTYSYWNATANEQYTPQLGLGTSNFSSCDHKT